MKNITKRFARIGALTLAPVIVAVTTTSMSSTFNSNQYISIKIGNEKMMFNNFSQATNYIMRNKVFSKREIKIGEPRYLNKNIGLIDPDSLHNYIADADHTSPAYKMMNGKYTQSREKALKSYLGRSHLVAQYYDGVKFHDGNSIGLKQAKDAILSRQNESLVPFYNVALSPSKKMHINPFSLKDVRALQESALKIYNNKNLNNSFGTNVTSTFLLPKKNGGQIAVMPSEPEKGLQLKDLTNDHLDIKSLFKEWIKSLLIYKMELGFSNSTPYRYQWSKLPGDYIQNSAKNDENHVQITMNNKKAFGTNALGKTMTIKNISNKYFEEHLEYFDAFLSYNSFWNHFDTGYFSNKWGTEFSTWAKHQTENNFFNGTLNIVNTNPYYSGYKPGYDVRINDYGSYSQVATTATLSAEIDTKQHFTYENFKKFIDTKLNNSDGIINIIDPKVKKLIQNTFLLKEMPQPKNGATSSSIINEKIKALKALKGKTLSDISSSPGEMIKTTPIKTPELSGKIKKFQNYINELYNDNSYLNPPHNNNYPSTNNQPNNILTLHALFKQHNFKELLIVNGTPIASIKSKDTNSGEPELQDCSIFNNISYSFDKKLIYTYKPNTNNWKNVSIKNSKDFAKKYISNFQNISSSQFGDIKQNKEYFKNKTPLLMAPMGKNIIQKGNNPLSANKWKNMELAKILTDKINNKIESINKMDASGLFRKDIDVRNRKKEINEDFFEPALVYVIYNDNDEIIDEFKTTNKNLRFDDAETIKHNAKAILTDYIRKDTSVIFIKGKDGKWMDQPIANKVISVYNLKWNNKQYMFKYFENIKSFIEKWVKNNSTTIVVKG